MLKKIAFTLCLTAVASTSGAETIKIGGSGSMISMLNDIAKAYMQKHPKDQVEIIQKSMGQPGGIAALNAGNIDIAMSGTSLTAEQLMLPIRGYEIAKVAGVVAITNDVSVANISSQQLCDIYSGNIKNWKQLGGKDSAILVFTRPESDSTKLRFRKSFACMANLVESTDAMNLAKSQDMFTALGTRKSAIGIVDAIAMSDAAGKFKSIKVDGNGYEQYESGRWPYGLRNHLVVRATEKKEAVRSFMEFVKTAEVQSIIKANKAIPVFRPQ